jgi:hypothetical protein
MDWRLILESMLVLILLAGLLYFIDRATVPRRHHDHLIPGTPRTPRRAR